MASPSGSSAWYWARTPVWFSSTESCASPLTGSNSFTRLISMLTFQPVRRARGAVVDGDEANIVGVVQPEVERGFRSREEF